MRRKLGRSRQSAGVLPAAASLPTTDYCPCCLLPTAVYCCLLLTTPAHYYSCLTAYSRLLLPPPPSKSAGSESSSTQLSSVPSLWMPSPACRGAAKYRYSPPCRELAALMREREGEGEGGGKGDELAANEREGEGEGEREGKGESLTHKQTTERGAACAITDPGLPRRRRRRRVRPLRVGGRAVGGRWSCSGLVLYDERFPNAERRGGVAAAHRREHGAVEEGAQRLRCGGDAGIRANAVEAHAHAVEARPSTAEYSRMREYENACAHAASRAQCRVLSPRHDVQWHVHCRMVAVAGRQPAAARRDALRRGDQTAAAVVAQQPVERERRLQQRPPVDAAAPPRALPHRHPLHQLEAA